MMNLIGRNTITLNLASLCKLLEEELNSNRVEYAPEIYVPSAKVDNGYGTWSIVFDVTTDKPEKPE